jgi:hypothetical protein
MNLVPYDLDNEDMVKIVAAVLAQREDDAEHGLDCRGNDRLFMGELPLAAAAYAADGGLGKMPGFAKEIWPLNHDMFKPGTPRENCIKAMALLLAEVERIDREDKA